MFKRTIKYTDFDGTDREEDFYFHLSKAELVEMEMSKPGGMEKYITKLVQGLVSEEIIAVFKDMLLKSYGEKSDDGKRFIKSSELSKAFSETEAYSILFYQLITDAKLASEFINGLIPADLAKDLEEAEKKKNHPALQ